MTASRHPRRWYLLRLALVGALAFLGYGLLRLSDPYRTPPDDFISSWAAGRLLVSGKNPYDAKNVLEVQRTANWTADIPYRIWYPPWAMPVLGAFGLLSYASGRFLWYLLSFGACLFSTHLLWRYYRGPPQWRNALFPLLFTFWPAVIGVRTGQISVLLLLGLAGFLFLVGERRWITAGACLPLVAIKPQLLHLFWIALALWVVREHRWGVLLGAAAATLALVLIATAADHGVIGQFLFMAAHEAPQAPASTLGTALRVVVAAQTGREYFWLQFVPPALSLFWFLPYWRRKRGNWDWREQAPIVVLVSLVTTAYGWIYDDIVLLVPIVQIAVVAAVVRRSALRGAIAGYVALNIAILAMNVVGTSPFSYVWVPFAFAAWWLAARRDSKLPAASAGAGCR